MRDVALTVMVLCMMAGVGLELRPADLAAGFSRRGAMALALLFNLAVLPALTWWTLSLLGVPSGLAMGLFLVAAAPGGPSGPAFARLAGGDLGFATTLMVSLSVCGLFAAPALVALTVGSDDAASVFWPMLRALTLVQFLPLAIAMSVHARWPELARRLAGPFRTTGNTLLILIVSALLVTQGHALLDVPIQVHAVLILSLLGLLLLGSLTPRGEGVLRSTTLITAVRNISVALLLSGRFMHDPLADLGVLVCGFYMMVLPGLVATMAGRRGAAA